MALSRRADRGNHAWWNTFKEHISTAPPRVVAQALEFVSAIWREERALVESGIVEHDAFDGYIEFTVNGRRAGQYIMTSIYEKSFFVARGTGFNDEYSTLSDAVQAFKAYVSTWTDSPKPCTA